MTVEANRTSEVSDDYERYWSGKDQPRYEPDDVLVRLLDANIDAASRCLDFGCGAAETYAQAVSKRAASYVGVDVSGTAVEQARSSGLRAEKIDDASSLPFEDDTFDIAICIEVFEHLFSPDHAAREIRRVLRPGGKLIVSTPNAAYWRLRGNLLFGIWNPLGDEQSIERPWRDPHIRFFTPAVMGRMLRHVGYSEVMVGAHGGCFLDHLTSRPTNFGVSWLYRSAVTHFPSLLGLTIHAVAVN